MKLILIDNLLNRFDSLRSNPFQNVNELREIENETYSIIESYKKRYNLLEDDPFINILNHIALDVNYIIEKVENKKGVQL